MAILVTGAAGFVGLNVTEHLLRAGQDVVGLDRIDLPARARREFPAHPGHLTMIGGSVLSAADLSRALTMAPIDAVIHCAVITAGAARERRDAEGIVAVNVQGAVATLAEAGRRGVRRFVYTSSIAVYGTAARDLPILDEDSTPTTPVMTYGFSKLACETLLPRIAEVGGVSFVAARLASVFGPWEYATGVRDTLSPMLSILDLARRGEEVVLSTPGRGDFVYARDVAAGLVALAQVPALPRTIYNLGSGVALTVEDWCRAVQAVVPGLRWRQAVGEEPANAISHVAFDRGPMNISRIASDAGFQPRFPFAAAAADNLNWSATG